MPPPPRASVVIPVFNRPQLLREALASVRAQTLGEWECIVVDDGSTDETIDVAREAAAADPRVRIIEAGKRGGNVCRNLGWRGARSDLVLFLDSDDQLAPHCLEGRVAAMEADPSLDLVLAGTALFEAQPGDLGLSYNVPSTRSDLDRYLAGDNSWHTIGSLWRRRALEQLDGWDERLLSGQDFDLYVRALIAGLRYRVLEAVDTHARVSNPSRENVGRKAFSPPYIRGQVDLCDKIHGLLDAAGLLTDERRRMLARRYYGCVRRWLWAGDRAEAALAWYRCFQAGCIGADELAVGVVLGSLSRRPGLDRVSTRIRRRWEARRGFVDRSQTKGRVPLAQAQGS